MYVAIYMHLERFHGDTHLIGMWASSSVTAASRVGPSVTFAEYLVYKGNFLSHGAHTPPMKALYPEPRLYLSRSRRPFYYLWEIVRHCFSLTDGVIYPFDSEVLFKEHDGVWPRS